MVEKGVHARVKKMEAMVAPPAAHLKAVDPTAVPLEAQRDPSSFDSPLELKGSHVWDSILTLDDRAATLDVASADTEQEELEVSALMCPSLAKHEDALRVPLVKTPPELIEHIRDLADIKYGDFVVDLGCGDGRIPIWAVKHCPGVNAVGVDMNDTLLRLCRKRAALELKGISDASSRLFFLQRNFMEIWDDPLLSEHATVIYMYLLQGTLDDLEPLVFRALERRRVGSGKRLRIVTFMFHFRGHEANKASLFNAVRLYRSHKEEIDSEPWAWKDEDKGSEEDNKEGLVETELQAEATLSEGRPTEDEIWLLD